MTKQDIMLLQYLMRHKTITGLEALTKLGIMSYTKRISQLRAMGVGIHGEWHTRRSRFGLKKFKRYTLVSVPAAIKKMM